MTQRKPAIPLLLDRGLLALAAVSLAYVALAGGILIFSSAPYHPDAIYALTGLGPLLVGAWLVIRRPGNLVGELMVSTGSLWSLGEAGRIYLWLDYHSYTVPSPDLAAWLVSWVFAPAWMLIIFLVPVFPSGRIASRWIRVPVLLGLPAVVLFALSGMLVTVDLGQYGTYLEGRTNPWGLGAEPESAVAEVVEAVLTGTFGVLIILVLIDLVLRWRRFVEVERLQMRSFVLSVLVAVCLLAIALGVGKAGTSRTIESGLIVLAFYAPAIGIGIAVARYRLYDIDRVINRTLVYAVLTVSLGLIYLGLVVGLQAVLSSLSGGSDLAIALTTLAVAALFLPARGRIQAVVDRRFNRRHYDAARTIDVFSARLREEIDLDTLRYEVLAVLDETMQPASASVWLRQQGHTP